MRNCYWSLKVTYWRVVLCICKLELCILYVGRAKAYISRHTEELNEYSSMSTRPDATPGDSRGRPRR